MIEFEGIDQLLKMIDKIPVDAFIYKSLNEEISQAKFLLVEEDEIEEEIETEEDLVPIQAFKRNMGTWLEVAGLKDILLNYQNNNKDFTLDKVVAAINFYLENDDFLF